MRGLSELLELLYGANNGVSSFEAECRDWTQVLPGHEVAVQPDHVAGGERRRPGAGNSPRERELEMKRRLWFQSPDRLRVEMVRDEVIVRLGVRDGSTWWRWDQADGATTGKAVTAEGTRHLPALLDPPLLSPARFIAAYRLEPLGAGVRAGRDVQLVRAWPREPLRQRSEVSYEFEFDTEHGTMLRRAATEDGRCYDLTEVLTVSYGREIAPERFTFVAPDGQVPRPGEPLEVTPVSTEPRLPTSNGNGRPLFRERLGRSAGTVWLTGLSGAGKTTLAFAIKQELVRLRYPACVLDGDEVRGGLSSDLGLSRADQTEQARRVAHVAVLIARSGVMAIVALLSPYAEDRRRAREVHEELRVPFYEAWVDTPLSVCEERDPKGLYARARSGNLQGLNGVDAPYEPPEAPDLRVPGYGRTADAVAERIARRLTTSGGILARALPWGMSTIDMAPRSGR